jgi:hypothetical protein
VSFLGGSEDGDSNESERGGLLHNACSKRLPI